MDEPKVVSDEGIIFACRQKYLLLRLNLNEELARKLIGLTGPTWAVETFCCYLANRKHLRGRDRLLPYLEILHTDHMAEPEEFIERMKVMNLIPLDPCGVTQPLALRDCERILLALRFLAQRY